MSIGKYKFGECEKGNVYAFVLTNSCGMTVEILNYGGIIRKLIYKNTDVVLGRDSIKEYLNNDGYFGAIIGRNSNRIENSEFELGGKTFKLWQMTAEIICTVEKKVLTKKYGMPKW